MAGSEDLGTLKQHLSALGIHSRGWRLYVDYGYALFVPLGARWCDLPREDVCGGNELAWLKILQACEMDVPPPPELVESLTHWHIPGDRLEVVPPMFLRLAWKALAVAQYRADGLGDFIQTEIIPLAQWFFVSGAYKTVEPAQLKAGWACMQRLRREYVDVLAGKLGADDWPPVVRRYERGPFTMSALSYAHQLIEEGNAMQHCVGDYVDRCRFEPLRIFSVRHKKTGNRVATLSLIEKECGVWDFDQLKGPKNAEVSPLVWQEAEGLRQIMGSISSTDSKTRSFLNFVRSLGASAEQD